MGCDVIQARDTQGRCCHHVDSPVGGKVRCCSVAVGIGHKDLLLGEGAIAIAACNHEVASGCSTNVHLPVTVEVCNQNLPLNIRLEPAAGKDSCAGTKRAMAIVGQDH